MPTYEYECSACHGRHEAFQAMSDKPLRKCPHCGKQKLVRQIGMGAGIIFKGSGFYETDYKRAGEKKPDAAKEAAPKTETPAAKPESPAAKKTSGRQKAATPAK